MLFLFLLVCLVDSEINTSSELNCDFSTECKWRNGTHDNGEWVLTNKLQVDATRSIMSMSGNEEAQFLYTHGFMGRTGSMLVSDVVSCQLGGASLKYWYYKTGQASQLDICIRQPPGSIETVNLRCYDGISSTHAQQWIFRIIELPPSSQPFEILFRATFYPPMDIIALDDIVFDAALCEIANDGANQGAGGGFSDDNPSLIASSPFFDTRSDEQSQNFVHSDATLTRPVNYAAPILEPARSTQSPTPRIGPNFQSLCSAIDCTFDDDDFCNYLTSRSSSSDEKNLKAWRISSHGGILNTLTGIPYGLGKEGRFVFSGGEDVSPKDVYILSTKTPFNLKESKRLDFFVYQAGVKGRLSVCLNTIDNCDLILDGSNITSDARKWINYSVQLGSDTHVVHFMAEQLQKNYAIGIDNLQLLNKFGSASAAC